jgi:serralysin
MGQQMFGLRFWLAGLLAAFTLGTATAQPPAISRWTGGTASMQPQGFSQGSPIILTWGFMAPGTPIDDSAASGFANAPNNLQSFLNGIYGSQAVWQPLFQSVFDRWSAISGITYVFEPNDDGAIVTGAGSGSTSRPGILGVRADLRIGGKALDGNSGVLAYNYFPNVGDMVFDTNDNFYNTTTNNSIRLRNVTAHEHGHGMGQSHVQSNNAAFLMEPFIQTTFDGPQYHDILIAQRGYGDPNEKSFAGLGNDVATRATPLGFVGNNTSVSVGNGARTLVVASSTTDFLSIDDNLDIDFFSFTVANSGRVTILLEALGFVYNVTPQSGMGNVAFDTRARSDLALALFSTNGTTMLASADATGLGGNEQIIFDLGAAGTYFIRITGADNPDTISTDTQFYGLTVNFTVIPEPATVGVLGLAACGAVAYRSYRRRVGTSADDDAASGEVIEGEIPDEAAAVADAAAES